MKQALPFLRAALRTVAFFVCLVLFLQAVYGVLRLKREDGTLSMEAYYEQPKNSVDLLVMGSSHAYEGISTSALWKESGIAAYNLCGSAQPIWNTYYYMKEALKTQTPRVIVLDVFKVVDISDAYAPLTDTYRNTMGIKSPLHRWQSVLASTDNWGDRLSCFFGWPIYHTRYSELKKDDLMRQIEGVDYVNFKGYVGNVNKPGDQVLPDTSADKSLAPLPPKGEDYLRRCIALAKEHDIPIVLTVVPHIISAAPYQPMYNSIAKLAQEEGVPFWDFNANFAETGLVDVEHIADEQHLNVTGASLFATFLANRLRETYDLPDLRGDPAYDSWIKAAESEIYVQKW